MANSIEYNRIAINDVRSLLSEQLSRENVQIAIGTINVGAARDKAEEYGKAYNTLEDNIRLMISQVDKMLSDVISAVDNAENS